MTYLDTQSVHTGIPTGRTPTTGRALLVGSYPHIVPTENKVKMVMKNTYITSGFKAGLCMNVLNLTEEVGSVK